MSTARWGKVLAWLTIASGARSQESAPASRAGEAQAAYWTYQSQDRIVLEDRERNTVRVFVPDKPREGLALTAHIGRPVMSDARGRFAIPMPPEPVPDLLLFASPVGSPFHQQSMLLGWTGETVQDVTFTVGR